MQAVNGFVQEAVDKHSFDHNLGRSFKCPVCFGVAFPSVFTKERATNNFRPKTRIG